MLVLATEEMLNESTALLQECWEECCARLGEALDEAGGGGRELEGDGEEEEEEVQCRLDACEVCDVTGLHRFYQH